MEIPRELCTFAASKSINAIRLWQQRPQNSARAALLLVALLLTNTTAWAGGGITIDNTDRSVTISDGKVTFLGTYSPIVWDTENKNILFLGAENNLYYPQPDLTTDPENPKYPRINPFRAYFQLNGLTVGDPALSRFVFNFGEENITGIVDEEANSSFFIHHSSFSEAWYTLDGRKLGGKPSQKGLYIHGGRKFVIK